MAALAALAGFTSALIWWILKHLQSDIDYGRKPAVRGTELAERATAIAEEKAS